jgi:AcrR family transcriptional regulator
VLLRSKFRDRVRRDRASAILEQTLILLAEKGYDGFRVDEVARRVGVAKGTVYLDFDGKDHLIQSALETAGYQVVAEISEAAASAGSDRDRVRLTVEAAARLMVESPERGILAECRTAQGLAEGTLLPCSPLKAHLESLLREAKAAGGLSRAEEEATSEALLGLLSRPAWRELAAREGVEEALRRSGLDEVMTPSG